jgi:hypothetical protein
MAGRPNGSDPPDLAGRPGQTQRRGVGPGSHGRARRTAPPIQCDQGPDPADRSYADWTWVACPLALPTTIPAAGTARLHPDGTLTTLGAGALYRAAGVLAKQHRLRRHGERLHAKTDRYQRLIAGNPQHPLAAKCDALGKEFGHVGDRRTHLNDTLAWSAARWTIDQAIAARATVIYLEDLRSMEARGMGRTLNARLSQQVRGRIVERVRHLATKVPGNASPPVA